MALPLYQKLFYFVFVFVGIVFYFIPFNKVAADYWAKYLGNPVLDVGTPWSWDSQNLSSPYVTFDGSLYEMWYSGQSNSRWGIGYAQSIDGYNWQKSADNPILVADNSVVGETDVADPFVLKEGDSYKMW